MHKGYVQQTCLSLNSGSPITREEVFPGKNPENQFPVELLRHGLAKELG